MTRTVNAGSLNGLILAAALALIAMVPAQQAHAQVVNGSFEADYCGGPGGYRLGLSGNDMTGWFIPSGDGVYPWCLSGGAFGAGPAAQGNQYFVLGEQGRATQAGRPVGQGSARGALAAGRRKARQAPGPSAGGEREPGWRFVC